LAGERARPGDRAHEGLRIFLASSGTRRLSAARVAAGGVGNCASCHFLPTFTDFAFHNSGASQDEYDAIHGEGAFAALAIPDLDTRNADPAAYLPASPQLPNGSGRFRAVPSLAKPGDTDLGVWNIYANADVTNQRLQLFLASSICRAHSVHRSCSSQSNLLDASIGLFKTPPLRDLGQSAPYLHTGGKDTIEDVLAFYQKVSGQLRDGTLRSGAPELGGIGLTDGDIPKLAAFLRSLNEDYNN
jgi:cytochrome c peroxidase